MNTRKRTRLATERESNVAMKMSKSKKPTRTETTDDTKTDSNIDTMNTNEREVVTSTNDPTDDNSIELNNQSNSTGNTSDELMSATDEILREADILMASIVEFQRENNNNEGQTDDDEAVIASETVDAVHQTPANHEIPAPVASPDASSSQASTSASQSNNPIDDSVVLIDDTCPIPIRPIVRDDDEDVIFVTETRQRQRTIATIDLCDTPDNSFISTNDDRKNTQQPTTVHNSPNKSGSARIGTTKCPICLEMYTMDEILSTMCGHLYCEPCIRNVIKTRKKCPMCNRALKSNQVHRIFLDT